MGKSLLMGNEIIAFGAIKAGVNLVTGYPGTPSTEILETVAKNAKENNIYVEWSVNEKSALEVAASASYTGAYTMVTMKQVGLNVASDPLMSLAYVGIKGAMVIVVADDPGPISSQTEQDTRHFAEFAKLPIFDPTSPEEAYEMIGTAFEVSHKYCTPVLFRPTTRICHGCTSIELSKERFTPQIDGFAKSSDWVIFPRLAYQNHIKMENRNVFLTSEFSNGYYNEILNETEENPLVIATGGVSFSYTNEALELLDTSAKILKIATPHPFPENLALKFLQGAKEVLCLEELDPVIEKALTYICGKYNLNVKIHGKLDSVTSNAGENSVENTKEFIAKFLGIKTQATAKKAMPLLPIRPPVLCAGCPHRASFYAVKLASKGIKANFCGDIGCYTLGNAMPLDMVDTCLCMGADVTMAQGFSHILPDTTNFAFIGDSTFFHTGIAGVVNAVYNEANIILMVLDNSTTAMTGHQPHPGTGITMMGEVSQKISIEAVLKALGVNFVATANPLDLKNTVSIVKKAIGEKGVRAIILKAPCIAVSKPQKAVSVDNSKCVGCNKCITELGCPAISINNKKAYIEESMCYGCSICTQVCPTNAIG